MTTTLAPGLTFALRTTAPTPVMTPQPMMQARSNGMSRDTTIAPDCGTTVYSACVDVTKKMFACGLNCAVTLATLSIVSVQIGALPAQSPDQPRNFDPASVDAAAKVRGAIANGAFVEPDVGSRVTRVMAGSSTWWRPA